MRPSHTEKFFIQGPVGQLEAIIEFPETQVARKGVAVCCHPHPLHGGSMTNKVTYTLARAQVALGLIAVRFNFRGIGKSEGSFAEGIGEQDDLRAVIAWVKKEFPDYGLWLSGFSFGSWISAAVAHEYEVEQLISIAPPVERGVFDDMEHPFCDWLAVMGDADEVVSFEKTDEWIESLHPKPEWIVLEGAGHFFHSRLVELRDVLEEQLKHRVSDLPLVGG
ncbi:alpha/beta hydrolase [Pleionea sediminis]|uniref:alpha/beta hydrolase n=1 Tax=Pleionea sediminis TaxID=2569479 RepID=UPI0011869EA1|nr:alpha/beta hydrolase [Pleionea sediminis]